MTYNEVPFVNSAQGADDDTKLLDSRELAATLGCSVSTVKRQVNAGAIPVVRIGRLVRFRRGDVALLISALTAPAELDYANAEEAAP